MKPLFVLLLLFISVTSFSQIKKRSVSRDKNLGQPIPVASTELQASYAWWKYINHSP